MPLELPVTTAVWPLSELLILRLTSVNVDRSSLRRKYDSSRSIVTADTIGALAVGLSRLQHQHLRFVAHCSQPCSLDAAAIVERKLTYRRAIHDELRQSNSRIATSRGRARHRWFPVAGARRGGWLVDLRRRAHAQYQTFNHFLVVARDASSLISLWYLSFGGGEPAIRDVWSLADCGWRWCCSLRFSGRCTTATWASSVGDCGSRAMPTNSLQPIESAGEADDWQTTPRDYPRFLGQRLLGRGARRRAGNGLESASAAGSCGGARSAPAGRRSPSSATTP